MSDLVRKLPIQYTHPDGVDVNGGGGGGSSPQNDYVERSELAYYVRSNDLADVAITGDYNALINKPEIPQQDNFIVLRTSYYHNVWRISSPNNDKTLDNTKEDAIIHVNDAWLNTDYSEGRHYGLDLDKTNQLWFYIASKTFSEGVYLLNRLAPITNDYIPYCIRDLDYKQNILGFCKCFTYVSGGTTYCALHVFLPYYINIIEAINSSSYLRYHRCIIQCIGEESQHIDFCRVFFHDKMIPVEVLNTYVDGVVIQTNNKLTPNTYYEVDFYKQTNNGIWRLNLKKYSN